MRVNVHRGFGLAPGEFRADVQARLDAAYPEKMYFGWANFNTFVRPMTAGLFGTPDTYSWFKRTYGRAPLAVFNDPDFDLDPVTAGREPNFSRITAKLAKIDRDLANYHGPIANMSAGPAVSFEPDSPAYAGVGSSTILFNTPGGPVTVVNGVPTGGGSSTGGKTKVEMGSGNTMLWVGLGLAGVAVLLFSKGN